MERRLLYQSTSTNSKAGFTLFETLLVLLILSLTLVLTPRLPAKVGDDLATRAFFEQLKTELIVIQDEAMIHVVYGHVRFSPEGFVRFYHLGENLQASMRTLYVPPGWRILSHFEFNYKPTGHIDEFRTVYFAHDSGKRVKLVFQMGSGKFEIK